jgi:hypothetical protein
MKLSTGGIIDFCPFESDDSGQDSNEEIFIDDLVTSVTNATTLTTFSSADLKPNRAPLPNSLACSLPKSESSQLTTVSNFALPAVTVTSSPISASKTAVNFPSVPKTLAPFEPTAPAKTTASACANFSVQKTGQVNSTAVTVTSTTVKQLPTPITKSTHSPSTVTVVDKSQLPITASSTVKTVAPIPSTPVNYDYGYEPSYYYENEVSVISEVSSVASVPEPTSADRKLPPGAVPMPHMQQW